MQSPGFEYKKYLQLIARRKALFVALALLIATAAFVASFLLPRKYESSSTVFIEKNVVSELVKDITFTPSMEDTIKVLTYAITSRTLVAKVADTLDPGLARREGGRAELIKKLQRNTSVKVKDKNLFTISFTDSNPKVARDFVNTLVRLYIRENLASKLGETDNATQFLSEQLDVFHDKLEKAEKEVNAYKRDKGGMISMDENKIFEEIGVSQQKLYDLQLRRRQLEGMRKVTRKGDDPLQARLAALQKRLDELRVQYTDSYPDVISVKSDLETVQAQLRTRKGGVSQPLDPQELAKIDSEIGALRVTEEGLSRYIAANKKLLQEIPNAKAGLETLELEKKNQKNIYDQLYARRGQSEVSGQMQVQDKSTTFRVVDPAILPLKPISPNRPKIMFSGVAAGLAGSFWILLLLDQLDGSVKDVKSVKGLGLPVLAVIPRMQDPLVQARQRKRSARMFAAAACYLLVMLCFAVMELLGLPYLDRLLDGIHSPVAVAQEAKGLSR
jgi:polysaccharide biosynthesis transport protein